MSEENGKVICPVCEQVISDFEAGESNPCEHVLLIYSDICGNEFVHTHASMQETASEMEKKYMEDDVYLDDLMKEYAEEHGHEILEMVTSGMACGPCSNTEYVMVSTE
jgi:uncharacterized Zn finger protein (UPF0148 family)